jgi:NAD(P)-dependent dehydrogenase (short-subunit alcohol dehydrogenase family)
MMTKHLAIELADEGFACFVVHPGWVRTDMGGPNATLSTEASVRQLLDHAIEPAAPDTHNGAYLNYDGEPLPW